jgi:hypothetical protein
MSEPNKRSQPSPLGLAALYGLILVAAGVGLLWRLGDRPLWVDEAETAVLAEHTSRLGLPYARDGRNDIAFLTRQHWVNADGVWLWSPWLDEYVAAGSFLLLGKTTLAARLPFVLAAWGSVVLLTWLAWQVRRSHELALMTALIITSSVPFYLHARQCRYFALAMLAQVVLLVGFWLVARCKSALGGWLIVGALVAQFYSNYIAVLGNGMAVAIAVLARRKQHPELFSQAMTWAGGVALAAIPWVMYSGMLKLQARVTGGDWTLDKLGYYLAKLNDHLLPLALLLVPLAWWIWRRFFAARGAEAPSPAVAMGEANSLAEAEISLVWLLGGCVVGQVAAAWMAQGEFFRYLIPLAPVSALLAAEVCYHCLPQRALRWGIVASLCLSNVWSWAGGQAWQSPQALASPIWAYAQELSQPYTDRFEDVVAYLQEHGSPEDSVLVANEEMPLIFHTGMQILDARMQPSIDANDPPDWILTESPSAMVDKAKADVPPALAGAYERIELPVHDNPSYSNHPDPELRSPLTTEELRTLVLYRKKPGPVRLAE